MPSMSEMLRTNSVNDLNRFPAIRNFFRKPPDGKFRYHRPASDHPEKLGEALDLYVCL